MRFPAPGRRAALDLANTGALLDNLGDLLEGSELVLVGSLGEGANLGDVHSSLAEVILWKAVSTLLRLPRK